MTALMWQVRLFPSPLAGEGGPQGRSDLEGLRDPSSVWRFAPSTVSRKGRTGALAIVGLLGLAPVATAQTATPVPNVTSGQPQASFGQNGATTIKRLLDDGYEIKTGFVDPNGGAYLALQKATSAYFCHSNPNPTCEKLN